MRDAGADICCDFLHLSLTDRLEVPEDAGAGGCFLSLNSPPKLGHAVQKSEIHERIRRHAMSNLFLWS